METTDNSSCHLQPGVQCAESKLYITELNDGEEEEEEEGGAQNFLQVLEDKSFLLTAVCHPDTGLIGDHVITINPVTCGTWSNRQRAGRQLTAPSQSQSLQTESLWYPTRRACSIFARTPPTGDHLKERGVVTSER